MATDNKLNPAIQKVASILYELIKPARACPKGSTATVAKIIILLIRPIICLFVDVCIQVLVIVESNNTITPQTINVGKITQTEENKNQIKNHNEKIKC